uniref:Nucleotide-diphospho-sugar transferase domain-containing protein n=2 Tax=Tetraselmis sp. GSL018 TaxID=582737 RepID=A0A061R0L6_9CHLO
MAELLRRVSVDGEVMLALANGVMICRNTTICWWNGGNILGSWLRTLRHAGITNYAIAVLDDETERYLREEEGETKFFRPALRSLESLKGSHPANQVSALKYGLVGQILRLGYGVLVADMDLVFLKNPFRHLHRDSDLESQTDGFTEPWAYGRFGGINDPTMGWGGGGLYLQVFTLNVGCAYLRPNERTVALMDRMQQRLRRGPAWDQQVFNEEVWLPSHGGFRGSQVSVRVMDIFQFVNSKTFFRSSRPRFIPGRKQNPSEHPVMVHMNYHPDKHRRMLCLIARYIDGRWDACDGLPGGSEPGT